MNQGNTRALESTGESVPLNQLRGKIGGAFTFFTTRNAIFEKVFQEQKEIYKNLPRRPIKITLKDGKVMEGNSFETSPADIAKKISKKLLLDAVVAKVTYVQRDQNPVESGCIDADSEFETEEDHNVEKQQNAETWDLQRPLEGDCHLEILTFEDPEGQTTFWHSSAHILGSSLEQMNGSYLWIGPPLKNGFYYDVYMGDEHVVPDQFEQLETIAKKVISTKSNFDRVVLNKQQALEMFEYNPFKIKLISNKIPDNGKCTVYRCGNLIDLCTGPHVSNTEKIKAFKVTKASSAYWLGQKENDSLQRVYGIAFPSPKELQDYVKLQEELAKRDHRNIGVQQNLFKFNTMSPGSAFMLPHGAIIYNKLVQFIRDEYRVRGYTEVVTPNMYNANLWKISGHWDKYQQNMFVVKMEDEGTEKNVQYGLKPMNCPGHCLMFDMSLYSYRDLPIRFADFGVLHRNELHGALTGLTRVRRFQQDDAHIFCTADQIMDEVMNTLDFIQHCYKIFGFEFNLELSTKPENAIGDQQLWDKAEAALIEALNKFGRPWKINPGDGAFYGPKIDIKIFDSLKREHQCGTVQLDFNNPIRFNLQYRSSEDDCKKQEGTAEPGLKPGFARPIMIHRAVLGSVERMLAILCEHTGGKWPFWVSPRQVKVIPISEKFKVYAEQIHNRLILEGFCSEIDHSNDTINKKVRNAQLEQFNYMAVVGEKEQEAGTVNLRNRDEKDPIGVLNMNQLLQLFKSLSPEPSQARLAVEKNSFKCTGQNHLNELNNELQLKTFLNGEGFELGPRDQETFESLKDQDISQFPNIQRWYAYLKQKQQ